MMTGREASEGDIRRPPREPGVRSLVAEHALQACTPGRRGQRPRKLETAALSLEYCARRTPLASQTCGVSGVSQTTQPRWLLDCKTCAAWSEAMHTMTASDLQPCERYSSICWPNGQMAGYPPAAMFAFFRSSSATNLSFAEASGSSRMLRSCCRCEVLSRCEMSTMASRASAVRPSGATCATSR